MLGCVALLAALLALVATQAMTALLRLPIPLKIVLTVAMIAPLGFAMGMPFPSALRRLEEWHAPSVRWAWSLNAASSVLGSVAALMCAIYLGLAQTLIIGVKEQYKRILHYQEFQKCHCARNVGLVDGCARKNNSNPNPQERSSKYTFYRRRLSVFCLRLGNSKLQSQIPRRV